MSPAVIQGNDQVTGHIISTTIGGKNGEPKRVRMIYENFPFIFYGDECSLCGTLMHSLVINLFYRPSVTWPSGLLVLDRLGLSFRHAYNALIL